MENINIAAHRLHSQGLSSSLPGVSTAHGLVRHFGAMQGQEYALTKWSLGLRLPHLTSEVVEQELTDGKILRTHLLRPTWHLVAAEDIRWLLHLTAPRVHQLNAYMGRQLALDDAVIHKGKDLIVKHLEGEKHLTREELGEVFTQNGIADAAGHRLSYIMMWAELEGIVCSGIRRGNQNTYALLEERVPPIPEMTRDESLAELTRRYFQSRSPATVKDFATWSGLTMADCKRGIEMLKPDLRRERVGEVEFFFLNEPSNVQALKSLCLLPIYDEYIMGYKDRTAYLQLRESLDPRPPFRFDSMIVFDGKIAGTWRRVLRGKSFDFEFQLFQALPAEAAALLEEEVRHFGAFNGLTLGNWADCSDPAVMGQTVRSGSWLFGK